MTNLSNHEEYRQLEKNRAKVQDKVNEFVILKEKNAQATADSLLRLKSEYEELKLSADVARTKLLSSVVNSGKADSKLEKEYKDIQAECEKAKMMLEASKMTAGFAALKIKDDLAKKQHELREQETLSFQLSNISYMEVFDQRTRDEYKQKLAASRRIESNLKSEIKNLEKTLEVLTSDGKINISASMPDAMLRESARGALETVKECWTSQEKLQAVLIDKIEAQKELIEKEKEKLEDLYNLQSALNPEYLADVLTHTRVSEICFPEILSYETYERPDLFRTQVRRFCRNLI